ncbi:MAG TPA: hemophore-related protein [Mycobacterium sp.]|nr:hemophore-related protein [Mycobacterium sp.]
MTDIALSRNLFGVLTASAVGGFGVLAASAVALSPSAAADNDPCSASEMARTVSSVAKNVSEYLNTHPETNKVVTTAMQQPAGQETVDTVSGYFDANPVAKAELGVAALPLVNLNEQCKVGEHLPQLIAVLQAAQSQGKLPEAPGMPATPGLVPGQPGAAQSVGSPGGSAATAPSPVVLPAAAAQTPTASN